MEIKKIILTPLEVSSLLGVSRTTIYKMVQEEQIPFFKVRGKILFNRDLIEEWTRGEKKEQVNKTLN